MYEQSEKLKKINILIWSRECTEQVWTVFGGPSGIVVGSVVSKSRRRREERANARDEREVTVYGNSLRSANNPLCNRSRNLFT